MIHNNQPLLKVSYSETSATAWCGTTGITAYYSILHLITSCHIILQHITACYSMLHLITSCYIIYHNITVHHFTSLGYFGIPSWRTSYLDAWWLLFPQKQSRRPFHWTDVRNCPDIWTWNGPDPSPSSTDTTFIFPSRWEAAHRPRPILRRSSLRCGRPVQVCQQAHLPGCCDHSSKIHVDYKWLVTWMRPQPGHLLRTPIRAVLTRHRYLRSAKIAKVKEPLSGVHPFPRILFPSRTVCCKARWSTRKHGSLVTTCKWKHVKTCESIWSYIAAWCLFQPHWRGTSLQELRNYDYSTCHLRGRKGREGPYLAVQCWFSSKMHHDWLLEFDILHLDTKSARSSPDHIGSESCPKALEAVFVPNLGCADCADPWAVCSPHHRDWPPQYANFSGPCFFGHLENERFKPIRSQFNQCGWISYVDNIHKRCTSLPKVTWLAWGISLWILSLDSFMCSPFPLKRRRRRQHLGVDWVDDGSLALLPTTCDKDSISLPIFSAMLSYAAWDSCGLWFSTGSLCASHPLKPPSITTTLWAGRQIFL